jgi:hypothetical protein
MSYICSLSKCRYCMIFTFRIILCSCVLVAKVWKYPELLRKPEVIPGITVQCDIANVKGM